MKLLLLALSLAPAAASSVSALSAASAWLQNHKAPTDDQLAELRNSNPAAFALVNSLLSKHAKGEIKLSAEDRGPDVFRKMMTPRHLAAAETSVSLPYATSNYESAPVDQAHYNPKSAADKDETMVDKLLGAVAGLAGDKGKKIALLRQRRHKKQENENLLTKDADLFGEESHSTPAQVVEQAREAVEVPQVQEQAAPAPTNVHENSYLKGIDLSGDMPTIAGAKGAATKHKSQGADLASFSFDDVAPAAATPAPKKVVPKQPKKPENAFMKYLGFVNKAPAPKEHPAVPEKPAAKKNPYLVDFLG